MGTLAQSQFERLVGAPRTACANAGDSDLDCGHSRRMLRATHGSMVPAERQPRNNPLGDRSCARRGEDTPTPCACPARICHRTPCGPRTRFRQPQLVSRSRVGLYPPLVVQLFPKSSFHQALSRSDRLVRSHSVMLTGYGADARPNSKGPVRVLQSAPAVGRHGALCGSECI